MDASGNILRIPTTTQSEATSGTDLAETIRDNEPPRPQHTIAERPSTALFDAAVPTFLPEEGPSAGVSSALIANWTGLSQSHLSPRLFRRLVGFAQRSDGWRGLGSKPLSPEATKSFLEFWSKVRREAVEPYIALAAPGALQAQWFRSPREHLDLLFRSNQQVFFGLFRRNSIHEGVDTLENVALFLTHHPSRPLTWKESR